jgi:hypothetical protein
MSEVPRVSRAETGFPESMVNGLQAIGLLCTDISRGYQSAQLASADLTAALNRAELLQDGVTGQFWSGHVHDALAEAVRYRENLACTYLDVVVGYLCSVRAMAMLVRDGVELTEDTTGAILTEAMKRGSDLDAVTEVFESQPVIIPMCGPSQEQRLRVHHAELRQMVRPAVTAARHSGAGTLRALLGDRLIDEIETVLSCLEPMHRYAQSLHFMLASRKRVACPGSRAGGWQGASISVPSGFAAPVRG